MKIAATAGVVGLLVVGAWGSSQQFRSDKDDSTSPNREYRTMAPSMTGRGMRGGGVMSRGMMGRGMMGGGMMRARPGDHRKMDFCREQMGDWSRQAQLSEPITKDEAQQMAEKYLASTGNSGLEVGEIEDNGTRFEVQVLTKKEGDLVFTILIDKATGQMRPKQ